MLTQLMPALKVVAPLTLLILTFVLLDRKREVDRQDNPILVHLSVSVMLCLAGAACLWGSVQALHDPAACPGDISAQIFFGASAAAFLLAGLFYHAKLTLYGDSIERRRLPFWKSIYPLEHLVEATDGKDGPLVLKFSDGRKITLSPGQSGRKYFIVRLRTLVPRAFDVVEKRWADEWARTRQKGRSRFLIGRVLQGIASWAFFVALVLALTRFGIYHPNPRVLHWYWAALLLAVILIAALFGGWRMWRDEERRFSGSPNVR